MRRLRRHRGPRAPVRVRSGAWPGLAALLLAGGLLPAAAVPAAAGATVTNDKPALVILVRHAEKAADAGADPPLAPAGTERARALARALGDAGVTAIVTSDRRRTRETAAPLAGRLGIRPIEVGVGSAGAAAHSGAVAEEVLRHAGGVVLVVGHSDTIPEIIAALGGPRLPEIAHDRFDDLFALVPAAGGMRLVRSRYGDAGGPPSLLASFPDGAFERVNRVADLPGAVTAALAPLPGGARLADPVRLDAATDTWKPNPGHRLLFAGKGTESWFVYYEEAGAPPVWHLVVVGIADDGRATAREHVVTPDQSFSIPALQNAVRAGRHTAPAR